MLRITSLSVVSAFCFIGLIGPLQAENRVLAEVRFVAHNKAEKNAGVWVDGQYVGYVKELNGDRKMLLLAGRHEIVVRQAWYQDAVQQLLLEPGRVYEIRLALTRDTRIPPSGAMGELKISANPDRAAVFVDDQFVGHVNEFDGMGKALLLTPGQHRVRVALPGYLPFQTVVDLRPSQKLKIETELVKGSITDAGALVSQKY
ncbi:MAG TPA: PEGA domain-containing protein [Terriglobales bacterium]|nr:PEGA domain-containing protein [Terriglobales bacterium]